MSDIVEAIYEKGVFRPLIPIDLPEHQRVTVRLTESEAGAKSGSERNDKQKINRKHEPAKTPEPWTEEKNARRCDLIDKQIEGTITDAEKQELETLQRQAMAFRDVIAPLPLEGAR